MSSEPTVERELLAHATALRALARDLVGPADADDLVQETALRALRSPLPEPAGLGGFLRTVLRRLAQNHRRDDARRRRREHAAAAAEALPPADALLQRRESLRAVTTALFELAEPYQSTLLLRYFEGLSPSGIARRTGTPLPTVKSRLQRGLAQLRDTLDRNDRARRWRPALLLATGAALPTATLTLTTAGVLMAYTGKLALAASMLGGAFLIWHLAAAPAAPSLPPSDAATARARSAAATSPVPAPAEPQRQVVAGTDPQSAADLAHPYEFALRCRVVDADGLPVEGTRIAFAPPGCALNTWPERTGEDGTVTLHWRGRQPETDLALEVVGPGRRGQGLQRVAVGAGSQGDLTLVADRGAVMEFRLLRDGGVTGTVSLAFVAAEAGCPQSSKNGDCRSCHQDGPILRGRFDERLRVRRALHPGATFGDLLLPGDGPAAPATSPEASLQGQFSLTTAVQVQGLARLNGPAVAGAGGVVAGTVFGEDGEPAAATTVVLGPEPERPIARTVTDRAGAFRFEGLAAGTYAVRAGGGALGLGHGEVAVMEGQTTPAQVYLRREATIRGRALGAGKAPLAGYRVEYDALGAPWRDVATVEDDGSFVLANIPSGAGRLLLLPADKEGLPLRVLPSVLPDTGEVLFDLGGGSGSGAGSGAGGEVRLVVAHRIGTGSVALEARIWQLATGRGAPMQVDATGALVAKGLPAGFYRVEIGAEPNGWSEIAEPWVGATDVVDLGVVSLPAPAELRLRNLPPAGELDGIELYQRRAFGDIRAESPLGARRELRLPAGRWLLLWRRTGEPLRQREFELRAGETTEVDCGAGR